MVNLSDVITGLGDLGTEIGAFLTNLTPGFVSFIATIAIVLAVVGIIVGISKVIETKIKF